LVPSGFINETIISHDPAKIASPAFFALKGRKIAGYGNKKSRTGGLWSDIDAGQQILDG
jgi:hypothetical protein